MDTEEYLMDPETKKIIKEINALKSQINENFKNYADQNVYVELAEEINGI